MILAEEILGARGWVWEGEEDDALSSVFFRASRKDSFSCWWLVGVTGCVGVRGRVGEGEEQERDKRGQREGER